MYLRNDNRQRCKEELLQLLALEYNCQPQDFAKNELCVRSRGMVRRKYDVFLETNSLHSVPIVLETTKKDCLAILQALQKALGA